MAKKLTSLRQRVLMFVGALILLSLLGSTISLYRITEVNRSLHAINRVSVPLGRLLTQLQADTDVFRREAERRLGFAHWNDPHWKAKALPKWIEDVISNEIERAGELIRQDLPWAPEESRDNWSAWLSSIESEFAGLRADTERLYLALEQKDEAGASKLYPAWIERLDNWTRKLQWGVNEYERSLRQTFAHAQARASELRTGLEVLLVVVVSLSLLVLWVGERALRPLSELTRLAREITRRGLRREDKSALPEIAFSRNDEVSALAREFHRMATALLEREKIVESQRDRLQQSNRALREMSEFNSNILNSIKSVLIVANLDGKITQCNPVGCVFLGAEPANVIGSELLFWPKLRDFAGSHAWLERIRDSAQVSKIEPCKVDGHVYGGSLMPLGHEVEGDAKGVIIVLEDLTEELDLQERLRHAENLAAIGRMSAQVAHEVRNPLHSIGLEAEMAAELAAREGNPQLKNSLQSILSAVDRLEKITENYLKLSRLSQGKKTAVDLGEVLESALATYAHLCESLGGRVDWTREPNSSLVLQGDPDILEQVLGNLLKNSLQALEASRRQDPRIHWKLGNTESGRIWLTIEDNGPGVSPEVRERLFTPFVTTKAQGTGLGLSFVKKVIEEHGGSIEYQERTGSKGACFQILLPSYKMQPRQAGRAAEPVVSQPGGHIHG